MNDDQLGAFLLIDFLHATITPGNLSGLSDARAHRVRSGTAQSGTRARMSGPRGTQAPALFWGWLRKNLSASSRIS